jgi:hypothetical protein
VRATWRGRTSRRAVPVRGDARSSRARGRRSFRCVHSLTRKFRALVSRSELCGWRARERAGARRDARVTCREHASASSAGDDPWGGLAEPDRAWRVRRRWQSSRRRTRDGRSRTWATRAKTWAAGVFASHPHAPLGFRFWGFEKP